MTVKVISKRALIAPLDNEKVHSHLQVKVIYGDLGCVGVGRSPWKTLHICVRPRRLKMQDQKMEDQRLEDGYFI